VHVVNDGLIGGAFGRHGEGTSYNVMVGKSEGNRPLGALNRRWQMNLKEIGWDSVDLIY
jgi:hypothetical protein